MFASLLAAALAPAGPGPATIAEHAAQCASKDGWSDPAPPVRIFANVYDVGTCGIVALLITSDKGHILIDGATAEAAPSIAANIVRLGFWLRHVKVILNTHEHLDHAGGLAELQRQTGGWLFAVAAAKPGLETGVVAKSDPQTGLHPPFPAARVDHVVKDGELVRLGSLRLTAHATPGHSPGSTSWSWRSCAGAVCRDMVYADSVTAVSADGYRFSDHPAYVAALRRSLAKIGRLKCDLLVTPHPSASNLYDRLAGKAPLINRNACAAYAARGRSALEARLKMEDAPR